MSLDTFRQLIIQYQVVAVDDYNQIPQRIYIAPSVKQVTELTKVICIDLASEIVFSPQMIGNYAKFMTPIRLIDPELDNIGEIQKRIEKLSDLTKIDLVRIMEEKPEIRDKAGHPDNLTQNINNLNTNKAEDTEDLEISKAHYIKLGTGGKWADECFENGIIRIGWNYVDGVEDINLKEWLKIELGIKQYFKIENKKNGATQDFNALKRICEANKDEVFITFHNNRMYWCQAMHGPIEVDLESKFRRCLNGWSSEPIGGGEAFNISDISGYLTKTQGFQGTSCILDQDQTKILRRLINKKKKDSTVKVESLKIEIIETAVELFKDLYWKDCEILADLIFQRSGWQRISMHGENMKFIDMQYIEPISGNRYDVQVKSGADKKTFDECVRNYKTHQTSKFYFITFNPDESLKDVVSNNPKIVILYGEKLAKLVFDLGLLDWVLRKSY